MKILLAWDLIKQDEEYISNTLRNHDLKIIRSRKEGEIIKSVNLEDIDVLIAGVASKTIISKCKTLRFIQSMISGVSHINLEASEEKGIITASCKGNNSYAVAEHTMMFALGLYKNIRHYIEATSNNSWDKIYSKNISEKNIGIIGLGNIGSKVAAISSAYGANVLGIRNRPNLGNNGLNLNYLGGPDNLDYILKNSDISIISVPKTPKTINLINNKNINTFKSGSVLINISRGPIVDIDAVYYALKNNILSGFATDVYCEEPNMFTHPIYKMSNVLCTPHVSANTLDSKLKCIQAVAKNIELFANGQLPLNIVNYNEGY